MGLFNHHKHQWTIYKAVFPLGHAIPKAAFKGLTSKGNVYNSTDWNNIPDTKIYTHYVVDRPKMVVTLYCKTCSCGKTVSCNAFEAQEYEKNNIIYEQALKELE